MKLFDRLIAGMNIVGALLICLMAVLVNADVIGRAGFNHPLNGIPELVSMFIVAVVFLQLPYCLQLQQITRSDAVLERLKSHHRRLAHGLETLYHLIGMALFVTIAWFSLELTQQAWYSNDFVGSQGISDFASWPVKACVCFGASVAALEFLRQAFRHALASLSAEAAEQLAVGGGGLEL
jgi:TRAP-type C4-dicarboxylate transport system permease small subunit